MTGYKEGDIALVPFPFTDLSTTKQRPALILSVVVSKSYPSIFIAAMITSQIESEMISGDYLIKEWKKSGLIAESKIRLAKIVSLEESLVRKKLGALPQKDRQGVRKEWARLFSNL